MKKAHYAIAIGASAGGLEPMQEIIEALPKNLLNSAFIIAQHLSPSYKSLLSELIAKKTSAKVVTIGDNMELLPNEIYVTPPDRHVSIIDGCLRYVSNEEVHPKPSINILFKSIAKEYGANAVGIILSGTGSDGADGIVAIKEAGGITIAQDLKTCKYQGMPQAAAKTGCIDYTLTPQAIGKNFSRLLQREKITGNKTRKTSKGADDVTSVSRILELLEHKLGVDFSNYKKSTIDRRLQKRMQFKKIADIDNYLKHVVADPSELDELFKDILIGVTKFYRDKEVFEAIHPVLKKLVEENDGEKPIRIWVAGCATGEEVYSLAISLFEFAKKEKKKELPLQIFATDIDQKALNHARIGYYKADALDEMPTRLKETYFTNENDGYLVDNRIKKCILFSKHDVTANPPFLKLDLISCRNLLIYFDLTLQRQVIPIFHYALNNSGYLLLGKSESVANFKNLFSTLDPKNKIFVKKPIEKRFYTLPQLRPKKKSQPVVAPKQNLKKQNLTIAEMVKETVYNTFEHPYVVVDENLDMLEVHKEVSKYLKFRQGAVSTNVLKVIVGDLQLELRALASQAVKHNQAARGRIRRFKPTNNQPYEFIRLTIKPLLFASPVMPYYLVIFEEFDLDEDLAIDYQIKGSGEPDDPRILQLEQELETTKEHMNTLVEELETSNEELQSTNEELQSSNEELQASNEELETSNEELQSTNEELEIAYTEIRKASEKIERQREELVMFGNRLSALFNSSVQGHILIESNYNIVMFNETAQTYYKNLFGRNLTTGKSYVDYMTTNQFRDFQPKFQKALTGTESRGTIAYDNDRFFVYHYIPIDKKKNIDTESVLISFHEITGEKKAEKRLREANKKLEEQKNLWHRLFVDAPNLIAILTGEEFRYEYVNPNFQKFLQNGQQLIGRSILEATPEFETMGFIKHLQEVRKTRQPYYGTEIALNIHGGQQKKSYFNLTFSPLSLNNGTTDIVLYATDVSSQVEVREISNRTHELMKIENEKLHSLFDSAPLFIAVLSGPQHLFDYVNPFLVEALGGKKLEGKKLEDIIPEMAEQGFLELVNQVYRTGETFVGKELQVSLGMKKKRKKERYFNFVFHARKGHLGGIEGITLIGYEVTDQVNARKAIQEKADYLSMLSELMPQKVFTCTADGRNDYNNSRLVEFSGLSNEELKEEGWQYIIHEDDRTLTSDMWKKALEDKSEFHFKHRLRSVDGSYVWHLTRNVPVINQSGEVTQWIGTSTDIHEQVTSEKQKDEFLNVASHELKTPLTTVIAYTELLKNLPSIGEDVVARTYIEKSLKNQERLNKLIADLLDVTRIQSGKLTLSLNEIDYNVLLNQCLENISPAYPSHQVVFEGNVSSKVRVDESRIEQVFANLISNGVKYSPDADRILISIEEKDGSIVTAVTDFGIGIPATKQRYIFNRFYRIDESNSTISGLGIGLYITSQIVSAHNGQIWLESTPGKGTTFYFSLPLLKSYNNYG